MTEKEVYQFYNDIVKVVYSEIEAKNNTLPVELLFEIHSAFDHLKRIHIDNKSEEQETQKAYSHLKRGCLDAFKLKLKYFNDDLNSFLKINGIDLIDNGQFRVNALSRKIEIHKIAKIARLNESQKNIDNALNEWYQVSEMINEFENEFFNRKHDIDWSKTKNTKRNVAQYIRDLIMAIIGGLIVWFITSLF